MGRRLLRWSRSRYHPWLLLAAQVGGAIVVGVGLPGGALLAATHPTHHSTLWTFALVAVFLLVAVGVLAALIGGVGAFWTRPVRDNHAGELRASAQALERSLESALCQYGDGHQAEQAFCAHYPKLGGELRAWDELREAAAEAQRLLGVRAGELMASHGITSENYNVDHIRGHVRGLGMERANGRLTALPAIELAWTTTAVPADSPAIPGPPVGVLGPHPSIDWIWLLPLAGETRDDWRERATPFIECVEGFRQVAWENLLPQAEAARQAAERVDVFQRDELPGVRDALQLIRVREAPRERNYKCETC